MSASAPTPAPRRGARTGLILRLLAALALGVSAWVHLRIGLERPPLTTGSGVTLSGLFVAQGVVAALVALAVLVRGGRTTWLLLGAVALASFVALVLSVLVRIPAVGPFPVLYEPVWYADKVVAAVSAGAGALLALVALVGVRRGGTTRPRR
ncbi:hypothetical protein [Cellulomonas endophytica]|uniref:hypothetical protein n=1 Tax=Cellulomonas endophytica TaxID=2494735 RepID=UPI0010110A69|nr:hypothetical protein [Cellulomonas endophytica]